MLRIIILHTQKEINLKSIKYYIILLLISKIGIDFLVL